jgi:hypothetical protein
MIFLPTLGGRSRRNVGRHMYDICMYIYIFEPETSCWCPCGPDHGRCRPPASPEHQSENIVRLFCCCCTKVSRVTHVGTYIHMYVVRPFSCHESIQSILNYFGYKGNSKPCLCKILKIQRMITVDIRLVEPLKS